MPKFVRVLIKPDGTTTVTTEGFAGAGCKEASAAYEAALGRVVSDTPTAEGRKPEPEAKSALRHTL